ncbi:hypothetical protein [Kineococcus sp. SYSU DK002]|uniref:hypothetical protein n=1 Tax=Kineococcus sp. SYSU DK002 TaxID=3383123 RepID=UPI003D7D7EC3
MSDPATLRARAGHLRSAARTLRDQAAGLGQDVRTVRSRYPVPAPALWQGTAATQFADALAAASGAVDAIARDVLAHAEHCDLLAAGCESEAGRLDAATASTPAP